MNYTQIISAVIALISALVSAFLIPWLKTKIDADKLQTLRTYVEIGVKAAEQLYTATDGAAKKAYVVNFLAEKGIQFDVETIDKLIEAARAAAAPRAVRERAGMSYVMRASELVKKHIDVAKNYKTVYMWGCFGSP